MTRTATLGAMDGNQLPDKPFDAPVAIRMGEAMCTISSVREALDLLASTQWPGERGPRHRDASEACLKVLDGHRSTADARTGFVEAAREAGILISR